MSSHYKRVEIKDILNSVTSESSEGTEPTHKNQRMKRSIRKKRSKQNHSQVNLSDTDLSHRLLSPMIRPSNSASTSKVHYCPMNHCSENRSTRRKLDSHFLEAHMSDTRWGTQPGIAGVTTFVRLCSRQTGRSCVDGWAGCIGVTISMSSMIVSNYSSCSLWRIDQNFVH